MYYIFNCLTKFFSLNFSSHTHIQVSYESYFLIFVFYKLKLLYLMFKRENKNIDQKKRKEEMWENCFIWLFFSVVILISIKRRNFFVGSIAVVLKIIHLKFNIFTRFLLLLLLCEMTISGHIKGVIIGSDGLKNTDSYCDTDLNTGIQQRHASRVQYANWMGKTHNLCCFTFAFKSIELREMRKRQKSYLQHDTNHVDVLISFTVCQLVSQSFTEPEVIWCSNFQLSRESRRVCSSFSYFCCWLVHLFALYASRKIDQTDL